MAEQKGKKGKTRRVPKHRIVRYWTVSHIPNMARRALRVFKHVRKFKDDAAGQQQMDRFISLHGNNCNHCKYGLQAAVLRLVRGTNAS